MVDQVNFVWISPKSKRWYKDLSVKIVWEMISGNLAFKHIGVHLRFPSSPNFLSGWKPRGPTIYGKTSRYHGHMPTAMSSLL